MSIEKNREDLKALAGYSNMTATNQKAFTAAMWALEGAVITALEEPLDSSMHVSDPMTMWGAVTDAIGQIRASRNENT